MSKHTYSVPTDGFTATELAQAQALSNTQEAANKAAMGRQIKIGSRQQVDIQGGVITSTTSTRKDGSSTAYVTQSAPGFIEIPGAGKTTIEAAKAGGLIPHNWVEGQPLPFEQPAKAPTEAKAGTNNAPEDAPTETHAAHLAKLAGGVLDQVDTAHGAAVTDALVEQVVESGAIESILDQIPKGFQDVHVKQVMAGYIAQADSALGVVGSSVPMLQEMLTDDELRTARRATLGNSKDTLQDLGRLAVDRLAKLPSTDPQGFQEMVEAMDAKSKEMLRFDRNLGEWILTTPDGNKMTYGAAVRMGFIRV